MAQEMVPSPRSPEQPALSPRPQGSAPELHQEPELRELAQLCPCPPCPALPRSVEGASPVVSDSPVPNSPPKSPPGQGLEGQESPKASPRALGPSSPHLTELPKTRTPSQEPGVTSTDPQDTTTAAAHPNSPRSMHVLEQSDQASECKSCLSSVDAAPLLPGPACPALQETMRLIQDEFAFDGYLDNGLEALIMGTRAPGPGMEHTPGGLGKGDSGQLPSACTRPRGRVGGPSSHLPTRIQSHAGPPAPQGSTSRA